jgi:uncharacterized protein
VTLAFALTLAATGFAGAFIAGLVGVGGAIVMIPLLYYLPPLLGVGSLDIKQVAGVTMTQVLAASLVGAWSHGRHAMVHRPLALIAGGAMALGALVGAVASHHVSGEVLLIVFAAMATLALPLMLVTPSEGGGPGGGDVRFSRPAAAAYPGAIGVASGLVGAGGAFLLVPVLIGILGIPVRITIGTSLAVTGISASMGFLGKLVTAQIPLWPAVAVVIGALAGAPIGARVSKRAPIDALRAALALVIGAVAVRVWIDIFSR